ncbi:MAG: uracil phosphoribosyltransferase [Candidatus Competibacteraceae bacterium]|nr:uracil phosphoribosyltransferase [Candidatus Competibacteraceae bacterium]
MVHVLNRDHSIIQQYLSEIRDKNVQKDRMRFRRNMERMGEAIAYEISKHLSFHEVEVETPLGMASCLKLHNNIVLGTILRAGLPLHHGMLNVFDGADNAIISAYRKHSSDVEFEIEIEYMSSPSLEDKTLILSDPMLATGMSMVSAYKVLTGQRGTPQHTHIVSVIASEQGLEYTRKHLPANITYWIVALDPEMNAKSYIVPGIGDAGDLSFGEKLE